MSARAARLPLPPYGREYVQQRPSAGPWIAYGPDAWGAAEKKPFPVMVLPDGRRAADFRWPVRGEAAVILETGPEDDERLRKVAEALFAAGAPSLVALRMSRLDAKADCRVFIELAREVAA